MTPAKAFRALTASESHFLALHLFSVTNCKKQGTERSIRGGKYIFEIGGTGVLSYLECPLVRNMEIYNKLTVIIIMVQHRLEGTMLGKTGLN